jgi:hypothetical protein
MASQTIAITEQNSMAQKNAISNSKMMQLMHLLSKVEAWHITDDAIFFYSVQRVTIYA